MPPDSFLSNILCNPLFNRVASLITAGLGGTLVVITANDWLSKNYPVLVTFPVGFWVGIGGVALGWWLSKRAGECNA